MNDGPYIAAGVLLRDKSDEPDAMNNGPYIGLEQRIATPILLVEYTGAQGHVYSLPELAVHLYVAFTLGCYFYDLQATGCYTMAHGVTELRPGFGLLKVATIHLHDGAEIQSGWCAEELLKVLWMRGLW